MLRIFFFLILGIPTTVQVTAQVLEKAVPFTAVAPFMEPDGRVVSLKISDSEFILLSKSKGFPQTDATYHLERYDLGLQAKFSITLSCSIEEEYKTMFVSGERLALISEWHYVETKKTKLVATFFDLNTGAKLESKTLHEAVVKDWLVSSTKGVVKQSFDQMICASQVLGYVTPLQYQYHLRFSPDQSKLLVYWFDYGLKNLIADATLYDLQLNILQKGVVPIDNGFINYGIYPNNRGDVFILNGDRGGRIALIQFNLESKENKFLDMQGASTRREGMRMFISGDDMVYVANLNTRSGVLVGLMYTRFNFTDNLVDKINYYDISDGLQQTVNAARSSNKALVTEDNWKNFDLSDFSVSKEGAVMLVLEKREIQDPMTPFDPMAVQDAKNWTPRMTKVNVESVLLFAFSAEDVLLWENAYVKSQNNDIAAGVEMASYCLTQTQTGKIRFLYSWYGSQTTGYNEISLVEWDGATGTRIKDIVLENPEQIGMFRGFTLWIGDRLILAGKKGGLSKKSMLHAYKLAQ